MSTAPPTPPSPPAPAAPHAPRVKKEPQELTIISHSNLFYWWPVWAFGFVMALITWWEGYGMAVLPIKDAGIAVDADAMIQTPVLNEKGLPEKNAKGEPTLHEPKPITNQVIVYAPGGTDDKKDVYHEGQGAERRPITPTMLHMSPHRSLGVVFMLVLMLVISITNVPMRGMWSVLVIVVGVAATIVFIVLGWMDFILSWLFWLDIRINMGGYITISIFLFVLWLLAVLVFDKQRYITFTPGQVKVCDEIGGGEQVYSTDGLTLQKQRSDFFRHYVLGLGSGDLIVRTTGAQAHHIDLPNVLFINAKVRQIEELIARKAVIETN